jgi:hypothetical protein
MGEQFKVSAPRRAVCACLARRPLLFPCSMRESTGPRCAMAAGGRAVVDGNRPGSGTRRTLPAPECLGELYSRPRRTRPTWRTAPSFCRPHREPVRPVAPASGWIYQQMILPCEPITGSSSNRIPPRSQGPLAPGAPADSLVPTGSDGNNARPAVKSAAGWRRIRPIETPTMKEADQ